MNRINIALIILVFVGMVGCSGNGNKDIHVTSDFINNPVTASEPGNRDGLPQIKFEKEQHDFGLLLQGEKVSYIFKFKNIGKGDLIIKDASATCGCTVPKYARQPIAPGDEGEIEVIFDTNNRVGRQLKTVTVWTNCQPNQTKLQIVSEIVVPK